MDYKIYITNSGQHILMTKKVKFVMRTRASADLYDFVPTRMQASL